MFVCMCVCMCVPGCVYIYVSTCTHPHTPKQCDTHHAHTTLTHTPYKHYKHAISVTHTNTITLTHKHHKVKEDVIRGFESQVQAHELELATFQQVHEQELLAKEAELQVDCMYSLYTSHAKEAALPFIVSVVGLFCVCSRSLLKRPLPCDRHACGRNVCSRSLLCL